VAQSGAVGAGAGRQRQHLHGGGARHDVLLQRQRRRQLQAAHPHQRHGTVLVLIVAPDFHQGTSGHAWRSPANSNKQNDQLIQGFGTNCLFVQVYRVLLISHSN